MVVVVEQPRVVDEGEVHFLVRRVKLNYGVIS